IAALLGTKRGSPWVVPDETKLVITHCASRGTARVNTFGEVARCSHPPGINTSLFPGRPLVDVVLHEPVCFLSACSLRRPRPADQLNVGKRQASKGITDRYQRLWRSLQNHVHLRVKI